MANLPLGEGLTEILPNSRYWLDPVFWEKFLGELNSMIKEKLSSIPQWRSMKRALSNPPSPMQGKVLIRFLHKVAEFLEAAANRDSLPLSKSGIEGSRVPARAVHQVHQNPIKKGKGPSSITASVESDDFSNIIYSHIGTLYGSFEGEGTVRIFVLPDDGRGTWYMDRNCIFRERGARGGWMGHVRFGNPDPKSMDWTLPFNCRVRVMLFPLDAPPPDRSPVGNEAAFQKMLSDFPPLAQTQEFIVSRQLARKIMVKSPKSVLEKSPVRVEWEWEDGKEQGNTLFIELRWDGTSMPEDNTNVKNGQEINLKPGRYEFRLKSSKESCRFLYETAFEVS